MEESENGHAINVLTMQYWTAIPRSTQEKSYTLTLTVYARGNFVGYSYSIPIFRVTLVYTGWKYRENLISQTGSE